MPLKLNQDAQHALLTRLFKREDMFLDWEIAAGTYRDDASLSERMARVNRMILRVVDMKLSQSVAYFRR